MYCLLCGYDLTRTPASRCSECGTAFDRSDDSTYAERPGVLHRLLRRLPRVRTWYIERCVSTRCSCCGHGLGIRSGPRCPHCNSGFDLHDPTSVVRTPRFVPRVLTRVRHGALVRGVAIPMALVIFGVGCINGSITPKIPARHGSTLEFTGWGAVCIGVALLGASLALNAHYWWNRIEPWWRIAPAFRIMGAVVSMSAWLAAVAWAVRAYLF